MKSPRIISHICLKDNYVVQSYGFRKYFPIGQLSKSIEYMDYWGSDEIIITEIGKGPIDFINLKNSLINCQLPICYGGNVDSLKDIKKLLKIGIDKVSFNDLLINEPKKVNNFSKILGKQFIVGSVDIYLRDGDKFIFNHKKNKFENENIESRLRYFEDIGVGEFFLNFINSDGKMKGYPINFINNIKTIIKSPIIVAGGAGNPNDLINLFSKTKCTPVVGNIYNHFENPISLVKSCFLKKYGEIRIDDLYPYKFIKYEKLLKRNEN